MAVTEAQVREQPPDVRGPTAPLPAGILAMGLAALAAVLAGTLIVQLFYAVAGGPLTASCKAEGLTHFNPKNTSRPGIRGAEGICHGVEAVRSLPESILLILAIVLGAAAIASGFATYRRMDSKRKREHALGGAVLGIQAVVLGGALLWFRSGGGFVKFARNFFNFVLLRGQMDAFLTGAKNTLILALGGEAGGIIIGLILALLALSHRRIVRAPARTYINFFRGTPLLWQLGFFYFGFSLGLGLNLGAYKTALIVFSLNTGAYAAEVFRAGIQSIERGQMEAARGLGFSYVQAMRYAIVPQAVRRVIPPLMNEFVILIKDTSLVFTLGLLQSQYELYTVAREGYATTFSATFFVASAIGYLIITLPMIGVVNAVERRLRSGLVGIAGAS
ncbi:MAG TPA: amino acid ABC transporter permease [Actinomycetota bacterium]|jgi:His/Glu/Gln/Arg/opine family amino acid ABC transporter permease subunit